MQAVQNLSKHNLSFYLDWIDNNAYQHFVSKCFFYKSRKVKNGTSVNVNWEDDLFHAVKPLISHAISKAKNTTYQNLVYVNTDVAVYLKVWDEKYEQGWDFKRMIEGDIDNNQTIHSSNLQFVQADPYMTYFKKPFEIHAITRDFYEYNIPDDEEDESEGESITLKSYKEDKCVLCLNNEPKILFYGCVHYCVCHKCEERKPFKKCPCCRTRILTKIIV